MNILEDLKLQYRVGGVTNKLIYWNVGLFVISSLFDLLSRFNINLNYLNFICLSSSPSELLWKPWSIISYAFFHADFIHLLVNMIMLNFASRLFLIYFNSKQLLSLYFSAIIFAGIFYILCCFLFPALLGINTRMIGASGAIMAVLFAVVTYSPLLEVRLMLIGILKLWHIALIFLAIDLIQLPLENPGGHLAHLGGAFFGYIYIKQLQRGTDLGFWFTKLMDGLTNLFRKRNSTPFVKVHKNYNTNTMPRRESRIVPKDKTQQQIDDILDKISQSGYDSLSKEEKDFLFRAGK